MRRWWQRDRWQTVSAAIVDGWLKGMMEYDGKCPRGCPICTPEKYPQTEAAYVNMPHDKVIHAYRSFVAIMDLIADQGNNVNETMVIEALDDILGAWLDARETREMIRYVIVGARTGEIDTDARIEIEKTRDYLREGGQI